MSIAQAANPPGRDFVNALVISVLQLFDQQSTEKCPKLSMLSRGL